MKNSGELKTLYLFQCYLVVLNKRHGIIFVWGYVMDFLIYLGLVPILK